MLVLRPNFSVLHLNKVGLGLRLSKGGRARGWTQVTVCLFVVPERWRKICPFKKNATMHRGVLWVLAVEVAVRKGAEKHSKRPRVFLRNKKDLAPVVETAVEACPGRILLISLWAALLEVEYSSRVLWHANIRSRTPITAVWAGLYSTRVFKKI